jgi:hypothetical protein
LEGFRVLAPDVLCFGERQSKFGYATFFFDEINTHAELTSQGKKSLRKLINFGFKSQRYNRLIIKTC